MKKIFIIPVLAAFLFVSCRKEAVQTNAQDEQLSTMQGKPYNVNPGSILFSKSDDWKITYFQKGKDILTDQYDYMNFNFSPNNRVIFSNDLFTIPGTWYFTFSKSGWVFTLSFSGQTAESFGLSPHSFLADVEGTWLMIKMQPDLLRVNSTDGTRIMIMQRSSTVN